MMSDLEEFQLKRVYQLALQKNEWISTITDYRAIPAKNSNGKRRSCILKVF